MRAFLIVISTAIIMTVGYIIIISTLKYLLPNINIILVFFLAQISIDFPDNYL